MGHEISRFVIPDHQLMASNAQQRVGIWTDIGEAKITHTIFGRAKVRVTREQDKKRRAWLLTALAVMAIAAAAWQGWIAWQQMQSAAPQLPLSERIRVSAPVIQSGDISPHATPPSVMSKPETQLQTEIARLVTGLESAPQQPPGLKAAGQMAAKPVTAQPLIASKPQAASLATNSNALKNQTDMQQTPKPSAPISTIAAPLATQPVANKTAAVASPAGPLINGNTSTQLPAGDNQPPGIVNAQP